MTGERSRAEAVALFADRARSADARFTSDEQTGPVVARLVAGLDGMPLAIELAAARVEALGVSAAGGAARWPVRAADRRGPAGRRPGSGRWRPRWTWSYQLLEVRRAAGVPPDVGVPGA